MGCAGPAHIIRKPNPSTGMFPTNTQADSIRVSENIPVNNYKDVVLLLLGGTMNPDDQNFVKESFRNMGFFKEVLFPDDFQRHIIQKGISDQFDDVRSFMTLNRVQKKIGNFLVVQMDEAFQGGFNYTLSAKVTDPGSGKLVFHVEQNGTNWSGLDAPLYYPVFNSVLDWIKKNGGKF